VLLGTLAIGAPWRDRCLLTVAGRFALVTWSGWRVPLNLVLCGASVASCCLWIIRLNKRETSDSGSPLPVIGSALFTNNTQGFQWRIGTTCPFPDVI
jgi:hypothetical protein